MDGTGERDALRRDPDLLRRFRSGDRPALETVFMEYEPLVRTIVTRGFSGFAGFRNLADAEDAIASSFAAAFEEGARTRYDGIHPYARYLGGITRNVVRTILRRQGREVPVEDADTLPDPAVQWGRTGLRPEDAAIEREDAALLERFKSYLANNTQRAVFEGYFGRGLPEAALAASLGMNRYRVRLELARVRKRIARFLREEGLS